MAVREIDLAVSPGRTTVLIGPSGCGKSTLLRLINGLILPDAGEVSFGGVAVEASTVLRLRRRMGYVIQEGGLFPHLSARRNVSIMPEHLGWDAARADDRIAELAELCHLHLDVLERYPAELSGGQRQRVGLMRALVLDPDLLLLDEPLAALDPMIRSDLQQQLRGIFDKLGKTVVLVTHDLSEAGFFGDSIVLMRRGRIVQRGSFDELIDAPARPFVSRFVNAQRVAPDGGGRR